MRFSGVDRNLIRFSAGFIIYKLDLLFKFLYTGSKYYS